MAWTSKLKKLFVNHWLEQIFSDRGKKSKKYIQMETSILQKQIKEK